MYGGLPLFWLNKEHLVLYLSLSNDVLIEGVFHLAVLCEFAHFSPEADPSLLLQFNSHLRLEGDNCRSEMMMKPHSFSEYINSDESLRCFCVGRLTREFMVKAQIKQAFQLYKRKIK